MKKYFIYVILPAILIVILVNCFYPNPSKENKKDYI